MSNLLDFHQRLVRLRLRAQGFRTRYAGEAGERMHRYEYHRGGGSRQYLVLHGLGTHASAYAPLLTRLKRRADRVIAPELLGHGFSEKPTPRLPPSEVFARMARTLDQIIDEPLTVVGTSLGGAIALKYALSSPHKVARLILVSPAGAPLTPEGFEQIRSHFTLNNAADGRAFIDRLFHHPPWYRPLIGGSVQRMLGRSAVKDFLSPATKREMFTPETVAPLVPPTLLIWGRSEKLLPRECLEWFRAHMPDHVRFEHPERFGHSPHLEWPNELATMITDFAETE